MSNIHTTRLHKLITAAFLVTGILVTVTSTQKFLSGNVRAPAVFQWSNEETMAAPATMHTAALSLEDDDVGPILVGMLLVLAGFSFHALYVVRAREPMRIVVKRERKTKRRRS